MPKSESRFRYLWCCNPFGFQGHTRKTGNRKVIEWMREKIPNLVTGDAICSSCCIKLLKMSSAGCSEQSDLRKSSEEECVPGTDTESKSSEEEYVPLEIKEEATISNLNQLLMPLGQSPVSKRKLSHVKSYAASKASAVNETISKIFNVGNKSNDGEEMIAQFKEKFSNVHSTNEKYMVLTCLPKSWIVNKIMSEFGISLISKLTQNHKEIMSVLDRKYQRHIPEKTVTLVHNFYLEDDIIRILAEIKDTKSVKEGYSIVKKTKTAPCG
ncbi:hypothetical protein ANN_22495 [Periplaneta americana]|uniref:Uncharacterized protein n=1 Tax=Periplaneta americana TaxID=6978 RepID=A0ABQ8S8M0_PERAM|nr:hypothetical protein ANN_22495 [Periplaneta americana]